MRIPATLSVLACLLLIAPPAAATVTYGQDYYWIDTDYNVILGPTKFQATVSQAGGGTNGQSNTGLGWLVLNANTTGQGNTAVGYDALLVDTTGAYNTALGFNTLALNTTGTNNTVLGYNVASITLNGGSNNILIGTSNAVDTPAAGTNYNLNIGNTITGTLAAGAGGTALTIGTTSDDGAIMTFAGTGAITLPAGSSGDRPGSPVNGMIRYNSDSSGAVEAYINGSWASLATSGSTTINLGTSASATNPQRNGDATTGFYSDTSSLVEVAASGIKAMQWNGLNSGVDYLSITAGKSGTAPKIAVAGSTSPQNLNLVPVGTTGVIQFGGNTMFWQDTAHYNLILGASGLPGTISQSGGGQAGLRNVGIGYNALNINTTGYNNVAVGAATLTLNTTGNGNVAVGYAALNISTATGNTAVGSGALEQNTTGGSNTALGVDSLFTNSTGSGNTALGSSALTTNSTGVQNTGVGAFALGHNSTASNNTAVGYTALYTSTTGGNNTGIGWQALYHDTTGGDNTALGYNALTALNTGVQNTALGSGAGSSITTGSNNVLIGYNVASSTLTTGTNNILIGTSSAVDAPAAGTDYNLNVGNLLQGDMTNTSATYNTTLYLQSVASGANYLQIAGSSSVGTPGAHASATVSAQGSNTNIDIILTPKGSGYVGIGTSSPKATLDVNGYARLAINSSQPASCSSSNDGAIALTHVYTLCICKGGSTSWVQSKDGSTACSW